MKHARVLLWILGFVVAFAVPRQARMPSVAAAGQSRTTATIADVGWMEGAWKGTGGGLSFEERWTPPAGGAMLAVSRTIKDGRMVAFEFLRIVERDGGLVYVAQPEGKPPTDFTLTTISAASATFENPEHDFPKLIRYTKRPDGSLEARVGDGGTSDETYVFRRMP